MKPRAKKKPDEVITHLQRTQQPLEMKHKRRGNLMKSVTDNGKASRWQRGKDKYLCTKDKGTDVDIGLD
ncbi:hypothetical protein Tco_0249752 [Tanacetum coccineum]